MNIKVDFDNIVVKEEKNDFNVKVLMLKGEKGDAGDGENNVIEEVQVNGTALPVTNKAVNVEVPIVDSELNSTSINTVQNKTIYNALSNKVNISELNNYYEASEIDSLLNNKADVSALDTKANSSDVADIYETKENHNASISTLNSQITSLASGSPLVASSTSDMTDTTRVYVNITNGYWYYYDGNDWVQGGIYQASEDSETVNQLVNNFNNQLALNNKFENSLGYNKPKNLTTYAQINSYDNTSTNFIGFGCAIKKVDNIAKIKAHYYSDNDGIGYCEILNPELEIIAKTSANVTALNEDTTEFNFEFIDTSKYDYVWVRFYGTATPRRCNYVVTSGIATINNPYMYLQNNNWYTYSQNSYSLAIDVYSLETNDYISLYVGSDKEFATITNAVSSTKSGYKYNIYIDDGTYQENGIQLPNNVNLIGASGDRDKVIIRGVLGSDATNEQISLTSTINIRGSNLLKNLTITARNMRYPIHSESDGTVKDWLQVAENCVFIHYGNADVKTYREQHGGTLDYWKQCYAWGEGASSGGNSAFKDCIFDGSLVGYYLHDNTNFTKAFNKTFTNCIFKTTRMNPSVLLSLSNSKPLSSITFDNCIFNSHFGEYTIVDTNIYMSNCDEVKIVPSVRDNVYIFPYHPYYFDKIKYYYYEGNESIKGKLVKEDFYDNIVLANIGDKDSIIGYCVGEKDSNNRVAVMQGKYMYTELGSNGAYISVSNGELVAGTSDNYIGKGIGNKICKINR